MARVPKGSQEPSPASRVSARLHGHNPREAARVRETFKIYLEKGSLQRAVTELKRREWTNKRRITRKGEAKGGRPFDTGTLHVLLTNPILTGKIVHKDQIYDGEHEAIVDPALFERVREQLLENGRTGGAEVRNKYGALLRGLLRCKVCDSAMTIQWGVVTTKLQQVEKRLDEFIGEARSIRAQYAEMERKIWFLEGKLSGLTSNSPRQSVPTTGSPVIGGGP